MITGGIIQVPIVPICFAYATELTFPLSPATVVGFLTTFSNLLLFGLQFFYLNLLNPPSVKGSRQVIYIMTGLSAISFAASFFVKEDLRRRNSVQDINRMRANSMQSSTEKPAVSIANSNSNDQASQEATQAKKGYIDTIETEVNHSNKDESKPLLAGNGQVMNQGMTDLLP